MNPGEMGVAKGEGGLGRILGRDLFLFLLDVEVKRARRYQNFLSILILRLVRDPLSLPGDGLADSHKFLAGLLMDEVRETDILGVLDDDKFVALLPYADVSVGNHTRSRLEALLQQCDLKRNGCDVMIQQICFPKNGSSTIDLIKKTLEG